MENKPKLSECEEMIMSILLEAGEPLILTEIMQRAKNRFNKEWKMQTEQCVFLKQAVDSLDLNLCIMYRIKIRHGIKNDLELGTQMLTKCMD